MTAFSTATCTIAPCPVPGQRTLNFPSHSCCPWPFCQLIRDTHLLERHGQQISQLHWIGSTHHHHSLSTQIKSLWFLSSGKKLNLNRAKSKRDLAQAMLGSALAWLRPSWMLLGLHRAASFRLNSKLLFYFISWVGDQMTPILLFIFLLVGLK